MPVGARTDLTRRAVESIRQHTSAGRYRLVFVAGPEGNVEGLEREGEVVLDDRPFNFARRVNLAIERTAKDADVILINNDVVVEAGWFEAMRARPYTLAVARTQGGGCGNPDGWGRGAERPTDRGLNFFCVWLGRWVRRQIGPLDERFDAYGGEDIDYSLRAKRALIETIVSSAYVHHEKHGTFGKQCLGEPLQRGTKQFAEKWGFALSRPFGRNGWPRVSVVLANHNHGQWLEGAAESILAQSYPLVELVIVDDGSTDESTQAISRLKADERSAGRLKVYERAHAGGAAAKNFGMRECSGDVITFQDADDISDRERIERQLAELRRTEGADFCYTNLRMVGPGGIPLGRFATGPVDLERMLKLERYVAGATLMARRAAWEETSGFDESGELSRAYDFDFVLRAAKAGMRFKFLDEALYTYRRHGRNSCGTEESIRQHLGRIRRFKRESARKSS